MLSNDLISENPSNNTDKKSICISRSAWQVLQEFKLVLLGNRSYSDSIINVRNQLGYSEDDFIENLKKISPLPDHLLEMASLSRNSRRSGRSKTVVLSNDAWSILNDIKTIRCCKSYSEAILNLYHIFNTVFRSNLSKNTLSNSILSEYQNSIGSKNK